MTTQFGRQIQLVIAPPSGSGIDLSALRIRFSVTSSVMQTPNAADVTVYNLSNATIAKITQPEFTRVLLKAGYSGNCNTIFSGNIKDTSHGQGPYGTGIHNPRVGRESPVDTFVNVIAGDSDVAYNFAKLNQTIAAGYTAADWLTAIQKGFSEVGVTAASVPTGLPDAKASRGRAMFGAARDAMTDWAKTYNYWWSIIGGQMTLIPRSNYLDGNAVELNSASGMLGTPQQTQNGIEIRCLLNPTVRVGGLIKINNKDIQQTKISPDYSAQPYAPSIAQDGSYRVLSVTHTGDTRGQEWFSDLICDPINGNHPTTGPAITGVPVAF